MSVRLLHILLVPCMILYNFWPSVAYVFNQRNTGINNLSEIIIASAMTEIDISNNEISTVPPAFFTSLNFTPGLETIDLGKNLISELDDNWVSGISALEVSSMQNGGFSTFGAHFPQVWPIE